MPGDEELMTENNSPGLLQELHDLAEGRNKIAAELRKVIVGQDQVIDELLMALFANGHCLLIGVPGLAKTLLISTMAQILDLDFKRIQFTPDLMPSDIIGTEILEEDKSTGHRNFKFVQGPIFTNVLLADEINRTPPKTQAALLQAMQERVVSAGTQTMTLPPPFFVLATQNPIELEGTYPLPEAQLDRFMFMVQVTYPNEAEEVQIVSSTTTDHQPTVDCVLHGDDILRYQHVVRRVPVSDYVVEYAVRLARASRPDSADAPELVRQYVSWGAGPRASQFLVLGAKTMAALSGRETPSCEDVRRVAFPVLRHRITPNFRAEAEGIKPEALIQSLIEAVPEAQTAS
ncbi:MAG: MoxR family ATPase [Candidatus Eisenbacteria bacterium]|uniref:MoxR family ATPase n=1 Tax=Eiseniibacteriota bacterium TaxID=2212470 RepID=A0A7Y2E834_UNCEI|nr:MoxR family ATPase [Candidatus Eisenbacteria bacterium]